MKVLTVQKKLVDKEDDTEGRGGWDLAIKLQSTGSSIKKGKTRKNYFPRPLPTNLQTPLKVVKFIHIYSHLPFQFKVWPS